MIETISIPWYWKGKFDKRLEDLFNQYCEMFDDYPDVYADIYYDGISYDKLCDYIQECLDKKLEMPDIVT